MGNRLYELLADIRLKEGVDPKRYPPIHSDIQYDITRTMTGAEITARETADLILPAIRSAESIASHNSGSRAVRLLLALIVVLGIATTTLAWMIYQEALYTNHRKEIRRSYAEYLGIALLTNRKVTISHEGEDFVIEYKRAIEDSLDDTIRIPHQIPPEEIERIESLDPK